MIKILFAVLFMWISFSPEPLQAVYREVMVNYLTVFLLVLLLNKSIRTSLFRFTDWPMWLFMLCVLTGTIIATDKNIAWTTYYYLAMPLFLLFYIGKGVFMADEKGDTVAIVICACSLTVAIIGLLEFSFGRNFLYENFIENVFYARYIYAGRPMSTQGNPVILGSYLLGCFPFCLFLLEKRSVYARLLGLASSLICVFVMILTFSRGVFLGFMAVVFFYLWQKNRTILLKAVAFLSAAIIIFCSFQTHDNLARFGFKRLIVGSYDSVFSEYRFDRIKMTARILQEHPFAGIGFNHFRIRFDEYCSKENISEMQDFKIPDNMYLTFLNETGVIGAAGFVLFIVLLLRRGLKEVKRRPDDNSKFLLVSVAAFVGLLANMGAYELFYWINPYLLFCLFCGFAASERPRAAI